MARCEINFGSEKLGKGVSCYVILPDQIKADRVYPVLYLLHGYSDDHTIWLRRTGLERYCAGRDLFIVMPDGGHGFYTNAQTGYAYEDFMADELISRIESWFPAGRSRQKRAIGGLSMGAYGAVRLGLRHPDLYVSMHGHSGAYDIERHIKDAGMIHLPRVFGPTVQGTDNDIFHLLQQTDAAAMPALKIDCGQDDYCLPDNQRLASALKKRNIQFQYDEYPGDHNWDFWDEHIQEALDFHEQHFEER